MPSVSKQQQPNISDYNAQVDLLQAYHHAQLIVREQSIFACIDLCHIYFYLYLN